MTQLAEGLDYRRFEFHESKVHLLTVDLTKRSIRPVMGAESFPILRVYPIFKAIEEGALASVGGGFNTVWYHLKGYADQPLHALVVDREIWTAGQGDGFGVLIGENDISARQNRIQVVVWRPDGSSFEVERINRGHDARIVAFTRRGGTNQRAIEGKHYVQLGAPSWWTPQSPSDLADALYFLSGAGLDAKQVAEVQAAAANHGESQHRTMQVLRVSQFEPIAAEGDTVVLEARWQMKLHEGDEVRWVQRLGGKNVRYLISGWPQIIRDGENIVPLLNMDPHAPHGPDNWFVRANPRMVIGASKNGRTAYICTVQGRIPDSKGLRLKELASFLVDQGVHGAVNFDGGGSAYCWTLRDGLVADSTYGNGTLQGLRPDHWSTAIF